jgi:glycosyltransferase involved in cell wall biosynthesis
VKVVHLTTLHAHDDVRIWHKEVRTLAAAGFETVLLARVEGRSIAEGVAVLPIGVVAIRTGVVGLVQRLRQALRAALRERGDVYHLHDPELVFVGFALKLRRKQVVYDAHEDTPQEVVDLDPRGGLRAQALGRAWATVLGAAGRVFDAVVAATPRIAERFPSTKTVLVRNFPIVSEGSARMRQSDRPLEVAYVGGLSEARGVRTIVEAMSLVRADATLVLAGPPQPPPFLDELRGLAGWQRVRYEGVVPRGAAESLLGRARAGIVAFHPDPTQVDALPNKLFEYMAAGIPVIASDFPLWREFADGCGVFVDPRDPAAVAGAIDRLLASPDDAEELGARGAERVRTQHNWNQEAERLLALYARLSR